MSAIFRVNRVTAFYDREFIMSGNTYHVWQHHTEFFVQPIADNHVIVFHKTVIQEKTEQIVVGVSINPIMEWFSQDQYIYEM